LLDEVFKFDDAILAACEVLSIISAAPISLSELVSALPKYFASDEYRIECGKEHGDEYKSEIVNAVREYYVEAGYPLEVIDGVSVDFGNAWALVRQSNTQPVISLRIESKISNSHMEEVRGRVFSQVAKEFDKRGIPWPDNLVD
jgi:phosphomannomutase